MKSILSVKNIFKTFQLGLWPFTKLQQRHILQDISFDIKQGEIVGLLGPNGAGKTTLIQILLGTLLPSQGVITYFGYDFSNSRIQALQKIGYANGYDRLPARLTVVENLDIVGRIYGMSSSYRAKQIDTYLKIFDIEHLKDQQTGTLSAGQATCVMLIKAFFSDPQIVLLDEPTASLDPNVAQKVRQFILEQCLQRNISILITSHNMDEVTELCDRVLVLKNGTIIANNTPEELALSISKNIKLYLTITSKIDLVMQYLQECKLVYSLQNDQCLIECNERDMSNFFAYIALHKIDYAHVSLEKPTLENYFLHIAKK